MLSRPISWQKCKLTDLLADCLNRADMPMRRAVNRRPRPEPRIWIGRERRQLRKNPHTQKSQCCFADIALTLRSWTQLFSSDPRSCFFITYGCWAPALTCSKDAVPSLAAGFLCSYCTFTFWSSTSESCGLKSEPVGQHLIVQVWKLWSSVGVYWLSRVTVGLVSTNSDCF